MTVSQLPTTSLVPTTPFSAPWLSRFRKSFGTITGKPTLMSGMEPTDSERQQIPVLASNLKRRLTAAPGDRALIAVELAKLLAAFPAQAQSDAPASLRIEAYFEAIGDAPAWAVQQARLRIIRGEVGSLDTRFAPGPAQVAVVLRDLLSSLRNDLIDLERLSAAVVEHVPTPEERARVAAKFAEFRSTFPTADRREAQTAAAMASAADTALRQRLRDNGMDDEAIDTAMAEISKLVTGEGTFRRASAPLKRGEAA